MAIGPWILFFPSILHHKYLSLFRLFFILAKYQSPKHLTPLLSAHRHLNLLRKYIHPIHPLIETKEIYLPDWPISGDPKKYLSLSLSLSLSSLSDLSHPNSNILPPLGLCLEDWCVVVLSTRYGFGFELSLGLIWVFGWWIDKVLWSDY